MNDDLDLITVLKTGDPVLLMTAKSILEQEGIDYVVSGEGLQDLFGGGRLGVGYNPITGPIRLRVHRQDEPAVRKLFADLLGSPAQGEGLEE
ncbi:MAG: DUF2007 domain-containing protein [Acidobacteriota bacterium]